MIKEDQSVTATVNLYYDLHIPEGAAEQAPLLITVHGYAASKRYMMREAKLVAPAHFAIASLEGPNRLWRIAKDGTYKPAAGWLTDQRAAESVALHQKFILDVIEKHSAEGTIDPDRVYLHGFSQACALNFRFAFTYPNVLKGFIGICGGIPGDMDQNPAYSPTGAEVFYLYSDKDEFYSLEKFRRFDEVLSSYLPSFMSKEYSAEHEITDEMREDARAWLEEKEKGESKN